MEEFLAINETSVNAPYLAMPYELHALFSCMMNFGLPEKNCQVMGPIVMSVKPTENLEAPM